MVELILFFQIDRGKTASAARNWAKSALQTDATNFAFASLSILLLWPSYNFTASPRCYYSTLHWSSFFCIASKCWFGKAKERSGAVENSPPKIGWLKFKNLTSMHDVLLYFKIWYLILSVFYNNQLSRIYREVPKKSPNPYNIFLLYSVLLLLCFLSII